MTLSSFPLATRILRRPRRFWVLVWGFFAGLMLTFTGVMTICVIIGFATTLPSIQSLKDYNPPLASRIYDADDSVIAELAQERRIFVPISTIPTIVKNAFIAAEDQNFYSHHGVDLGAVARAGVTDIFFRHGKRPLGASTITQQVAKGMLLNHNSHISILRKINEAWLALRMEQVFTKDHILEIYLNGIYLGNGAYGIEAAAQTYFNLPLEKLSPAQAALLASLPKSPINYNPFTHPESAKNRRDWVLWRLAEIHAITPEESKVQQESSLGLRPHLRSGPFADGVWFSEEVRRALINRFGVDKALQGGLDVHTSMDSKLQSIVTSSLQHQLLNYAIAHEPWTGPFGNLQETEGFDASALEAKTSEQKDVLQKLLSRTVMPAGSLRTWRPAVMLSTSQVAFLEDQTLDGKLSIASLTADDLRRMGNKHPKKGDLILVQPKPNARVELMQIPKIQGAVVCIDPHTGRILALTGGWSFRQSQFDRATQALRQPGSSFKPFVYLAALEEGLSPSQRFLDEPFERGGWHPRNYEHDNWGPTTIHDALRVSRNLVTVRVANHIGMKKVGEMAVRSGLTDYVPPYLPAALGAVDATVLKEALAFGSLFNGGKVLTPEFIDYIQAPDGEILYRGGELSIAQSADTDAPLVSDAKDEVKTAEDEARTLFNKGPSLVDSRAQLASPQSTYQLIRMLEDSIHRGTGWRAKLRLNGYSIAGKTGTSQNFRDAWFSGGSPDLVTVVWLGYDTPKSLGNDQTGGHLAAPVWNNIMYNYLKNTTPHEFLVPEDIFLAKYDTGRVIATDAFKPGQYPGKSIVFHGAEEVGEMSEGVGVEPGKSVAPSSQAYESSNDSMDIDADQVGIGGLY